jgi:hypothetical protein
MTMRLMLFVTDKTMILKSRDDDGLIKTVGSFSEIDHALVAVRSQFPSGYAEETTSNGQWLSVAYTERE